LARTVKGTCDDTGVPLPTRPPGGGSPRLALPGTRACRLDAGAKAHTRSTHAGPRAHRLVGLFQRLIGSPQRLPDRLHGIIGLRGTLARDVGKGVARAAHRVCGVGCVCGACVRALARHGAPAAAGAKGRAAARSGVRTQPPRGPDRQTHGARGGAQSPAAARRRVCRRPARPLRTWRCSRATARTRTTARWPPSRPFPPAGARQARTASPRNSAPARTPARAPPVRNARNPRCSPRLCLCVCCESSGLW